MEDFRVLCRFSPSQFATVHSRAVKCLQCARPLQSSLAVTVQFISIMISTAAVKATCIKFFCGTSVSVSLAHLLSCVATTTSHKSLTARTRRADSSCKIKQDCGAGGSFCSDLSFTSRKTNENKTRTPNAGAASVPINRTGEK